MSTIDRNPQTVAQAVKTERGRKLYQEYLKNALGGETFDEWMLRRDK